MKLAGDFRIEGLAVLATVWFATAAVATEDIVVWHLPSTVVTQAALDAAPLWLEDQANPPLACRRAMTLARENLLKRRPESAIWNLRGVNLTQAGQKGQWMYIVRFEVPNDSPHLIPYPVDVIVLMNGHVVEPTVRKGMPEDVSTFFGFDNASVRVVLQYYSDLTGKELIIEDGAPEEGTITITKRTLSKTEAVAFLERELRKQAGLLVVTDGQRVVVRSDAAGKSEGKGVK